MKNLSYIQIIKDGYTEDIWKKVNLTADFPTPQKTTGSNSIKRKQTPPPENGIFVK